MKSITAARDFGERIEVSKGLTGDELVISNPPDSIVDGAEVHVSSTQPKQ